MGSSKAITGSAAITNAVRASGQDQLILLTATVKIVGPDGGEREAILFADNGSQRSFVLQNNSKDLNLNFIKKELISVRVFKGENESEPELTNLVQVSVRGHWQGAPTINLEALESKVITDVGPYMQTEFANQLWLQSEQLADERHDRPWKQYEVGLLIGQDKWNEFFPNEVAIQSPCGLRAYRSNVGRMIGGPSKEISSKDS